MYRCYNIHVCGTLLDHGEFPRNVVNTQTLGTSDLSITSTQYTHALNTESLIDRCDSYIIYVVQTLMCLSSVGERISVRFTFMSSPLGYR